MGGTPRHLPAAGLLASLLAVLIAAAPAAAAAHAGRPGYHPRADHLGVVVTTGEVLMSWHTLTGADRGTAMVRRGDGACPHAATDGRRAGEVTGLHVIDRSVKPGAAYCYTLFSVAASGAIHTVGTSGVVTVPDVSVVPPATAPAPAAAPTVTVSRFTPALKRKLGLAGGGVIAALLVLFVLVRSARRVASDRAVLRPTARESIIGRNNSALVVPGMIALGWICVLIGFVILR
jgi:hypothetical protein